MATLHLKRPRVTKAVTRRIKTSLGKSLHGSKIVTLQNFQGSGGKGWGAQARYNAWLSRKAMYGGRKVSAWGVGARLASYLHHGKIGQVAAIANAGYNRGGKYRLLGKRMNAGKMTFKRITGGSLKWKNPKPFRPYPKQDWSFKPPKKASKTSIRRRTRI
jgi:hypothetical protein